ncbi:MAG: ATP synthase subunit I [Syntrophaceticus sp.]
MLWKSLLIGILCGTAVSIGNYYYLQWTIKKNANRPPEEAMNAVINCYITRFFINFLALFLVFYFTHDIWTIAGTGIGLVVMKNVTIVKEYKESKKHPWKKKKSI